MSAACFGCSPGWIRRWSSVYWSPVTASSESCSSGWPPSSASPNALSSHGRVAPEAVLGTVDIFALSSDTEQMPNALLEAMAASLPVAAHVGDVKSIVGEDNREFIVPRDERPAFASAITRLLRDLDKRRALGTKNRERVVSEYSQERMFVTYSTLLTAGRVH